MTAFNHTDPRPLNVERIVDVACLIVERDGLSGLSMRKLGAELGVDPMAVYHHVANKRELLTLVTERAISTITPPDPAAPWEDRTRQWAMRYWDMVVAHRELTLAGLSDPGITGAGRRSTEPLLAAVAESGLPTDLVEPNAFLIVDAVHGAALAMGALDPQDSHGHCDHRAAFDRGIDTILAGITALAQAERER